MVEAGHNRNVGLTTSGMVNDGSGSVGGGDVCPNTLALYIPTRLILEICLAAERQPGVQVTRKWWEHAGLTFGHEARMMGGGTGEL